MAHFRTCLPTESFRMILIIILFWLLNTVWDLFCCDLNVVNSTGLMYTNFKIVSKQTNLQMNIIFIHDESYF